MTEPVFPPLMYGEKAPGDAFEYACLRATQGCDAGLVAYRLSPSHLQAAMVFAPEVSLADAMIVLPVCGVGFQNALGALAPPEVAVHLGWGGEIHVNGARCGGLRAAASHADPEAVPRWLAVALDLPLLPSDDTAPGLTPDATTLFEEGCADVDPVRLLEAWARHTMNWIGRWEDEGTRGVHTAWRGLAHGLGEAVANGDVRGTYLGVDERFGMLVRDEETTHLIPLTSVLVRP